MKKIFIGFAVSIVLNIILIIGIVGQGVISSRQKTSSTEFNYRKSTVKSKVILAIQ